MRLECEQLFDSPPSRRSGWVAIGEPTYGRHWQAGAAIRLLIWL
jgi:hypothetical protein